jgi:hypothetical protein
MIGDVVEPEYGVAVSVSTWFGPWLNGVHVYSHPSAIGLRKKIG